MIDLSEALVKD